MSQAEKTMKPTGARSRSCLIAFIGCQIISKSNRRLVVIYLNLHFAQKSAENLRLPRFNSFFLDHRLGLTLRTFSVCYLAT
jgi:hypothetical protein